MAQLIGWLLIAGLVLAVLRVIWPFIVFGIAAYLVVTIGRHVVDHHNEVAAARRAARDALRARADRQHAQVLRGNPAGVYGDYPAADLGEFNPTLWVCSPMAQPSSSFNGTPLRDSLRR